MWFFIIIVWIGLSILSGVGAKNKGRSFAGYFFLSLFLSPLIGLIAMAVAKPIENSEGKSRVSVKMETIERPDNEFFSKIAGVTKENPDGISRQELLKHRKEGEELQFIRDPKNPYDENAIKICLKTGEQLGFVGAELAEDLAPRIDKGEHIQVFISEITGGEEDRPTLGCNIKIVKEPK